MASARASVPSRAPLIRRMLAVIALAVAAAACGAEGRLLDVAIDTKLDSVAPFQVRTSRALVALERGSTTDHALVFESTQPVVLDDIRWTFASTRGARVFATAGHGCGPSIDTDSGAVQFACTEEYRYLVVKPGEPLTETITLYGGIDGGPVATGRFVFRQPITWWHASGDALAPQGEKGGEVTVTLTYDVRAR